MTSKSNHPDQQLIQALCNVASVLGQLRLSMNPANDLVDQVALVAGAESICLHTLQQFNWGNDHEG